MPSPLPLLSICVPTYNRAAMIERNVGFHLDAFRARGLPFEIVVVDDCSTDGTAAYLARLANDPEVRCFRRHDNSGFLDNYAFAMRRARGQFAVFLGDDDLLIPDRVAECVARLQADPSLGMIQAPWLCVDERPGAGPMGPFYSLPHESRFGAGQFAALSQFIFDFHVFPEFMIVRRDVLMRSISSACPFIFWAFLFTGRALAHADILFSPEPFARVTAISADPRMQQGNRETMFQWDHYRGGVEYLVSLAHAGGPLPLERRTATSEQINRFMLTREKVALRLHINAGNWAEAYILHHRIAAYEAPPLAAEQFRQVCQLAGLTAAAGEAAGFTRQPILVDPTIGDDVIGLLKPSLQERLGRGAKAGSNGPEPKAYLRLDPQFPGEIASSDAVFDLSDYMAQYV